MIRDLPVPVLSFYDGMAQLCSSPQEAFAPQQKPPADCYYQAVTSYSFYYVKAISSLLPLTYSVQRTGPGFGHEPGLALPSQMRSKVPLAVLPSPAYKSRYTAIFEHQPHTLQPNTMPDAMLKKVPVKSLLVLDKGMWEWSDAGKGKEAVGGEHQSFAQAAEERTQGSASSLSSIISPTSPKKVTGTTINISLPAPPAEICQKILAEVLGNNVLHLIQLPRRLGHLLCDEHLWIYKHLTAPFYNIRRDSFRLNFIPKYRYDEKPAMLSPS
ncbi:hypothetical protein BDZ45DRAFT_747364 [Acephala macrosclerotiorum]|nr:hypothetical protein BDZ45DRAFT_747364 [Acephala macrosclerotiorum]